MAIPCRYDPLGANGANTNCALANVRGCFVYQSGANNIARSGMVLSDTVLVYSRHNRMVVSSGGVAKYVAVNTGCQLHVKNGGSASGVKANAGAEVYVSRGGMLDNYNGGGPRCSPCVLSGGVIKNATVKSGAFSLNGYGSNIKLSQSGCITGNGNVDDVSVNYGCYLSAKTVNDATVEEGGSAFMSDAKALTLKNGATASISHCGNAITAYSARLNVLSDACVNGLTCYSGAVLGIGAGAQISNAVLESGTKIACKLDPYDSTVISGTSDGSNFAVANGTGNGLMASAINVCYDGSALNTKVTSGGYMQLSDGAYASNTQIDYGYLSCMGSCLCLDNTVNYHGSAVVNNGGSAFNNAVKSGGHIFVSNGGVLSDTVVSGGGSMHLGLFGSALSTTVQSGGRIDANNGELSNTVLDGANLFCTQNCTVDNLTCGSSGQVYFGGSGNKLTNAVIGSGAYMSCSPMHAQNITACQGATLITNSCVITNCSLGCSASINYGRISSLNVSSGAVARLCANTFASGVHIYSAGSMHVSSGCRALAVTSDAGAIVTSNSGAVIEYVAE